MTKQELSQVYYLRKEIQKLEEDLARQEALATKITQQLTDMPRGTGTHNQLCQAVERIVYCKDKINALLLDCTIEEMRIHKYIASIDDSMLRTIFTMRYLDLASWEDIALFLGGGNTGDGVRMAANRYLEKK